MADLRILVALALNSSDLSPSDLRESDVDRIGAVAFADPLGGALWALKFANDPRAFQRSHKLLVHRTRRIIGDYMIRKKIAKLALIEWLDDNCARCGGRGSISTENAPTRQCEICLGSGKRKASVVWRAEQLGIDASAYRKLEPRFEAIQRRIIDAEGQAYYDIARQLGRIPTPGDSYMRRQTVLG